MVFVDATTNEYYSISWFVHATIVHSIRSFSIDATASCVFEYYGPWIQPHFSWNRGMPTI